MKSLLLCLTLALAANAQCANCGKFHGGTPSSSDLHKAADKSEAQAQAMVDAAYASAKAQQEDYLRRANEVIAADKERVARTASAAARPAPDATQQALLGAASDSKAMNLLLQRGAQSLDRIEAAQREGKKVDPAAQKAEESSLVGVLGSEASRLRRKIADAGEKLRPTELVKHAKESATKAVEGARAKVTAPYDRMKREINELLGRPSEPEDQR